MAYGFLQDADGNKSSTRLVFIGGFIVGSLVILAEAYYNKTSEGTLGIFLTYCVGGYGIGKYRDSKEKIAETEMEKPAPVVVSENAEVNTETGDINVSSKKKRRRK